MPKQKIYSKQLEKNIINLLELCNRGMSIREITLTLDRDYDMKYSPQVIKRHLEGLKNKGKILEDKFSIK